MASDEKVNPQTGHVDNGAVPSTANVEHNGHNIITEKDPAAVEEAKENLKPGEFLPNPEEVIDALGIPNWRELEKKIVRRLDMTLMPCLWVLYFFNYMDRASIGYVIWEDSHKRLQDTD